MVQMMKRAAFKFERAQWVAIEVSSGAVELYRVEEGIEMFKGYIEALSIPGALRIRATKALYARASKAITFSRPRQLELAL
jgi:hypothetical protein